MAYLEMHAITKTFGSLVANDNVDLKVEKGHIHALLGENGAGKSTLMNILYGLYKPTSGEIFLDGEKIEIQDSKHAIKAGIGMVHQHFMLIPTLSVIENVVLGYKEISRFRLHLDEAARKFNLLCEKFGESISPWEKVENLSIGEQQRLEILKALFRESELLILDEPTAVLTPQETTKLFGFLTKLTEHGLTIIFITHKLGEVMSLCDRCTILRQGKAVSHMDISEVESYSQLAALMVGREVDLETYKTDKTPGESVLELEDLSYTNEKGIDRLAHVSFSVRSGEIVGIAGVDGNGQSELVRLITGLLHATSGSVLIDGCDVTGAKPKEILAHSVAHIPEDRHKMAMVSDMTVNENMILMSYDHSPYSKHGILDWKKIEDINQKLCNTYEVKTPSIHETAGKLSGGNQQKFVIARELNRNSRLIVAVYPARGLDIGTTKYIQSRLIEERDRGAAVLLVSNELDEIFQLSDRIAVLYKGEVMGIVGQKEAKRDAIGLMMAGIGKQKD